MSNDSANVRILVENDLNETVLFYAPDDQPTVLFIFVLMALSGALVGALAVGIIWWLT